MNEAKYNPRADSGTDELAPWQEVQTRLDQLHNDVAERDKIIDSVTKQLEMAYQELEKVRQAVRRDSNEGPKPKPGY